MSRRSQAFDIAVAVVVGVLGQLEAWAGVGATHQQGPVWAQSLLYAVAAVLLLWRRRHPLAVLGVMTAVYLVEFASSVAGGQRGRVRPDGRHLLGRPVRRPTAVVARPPLAFVFWLGWMSFDPLNEGGSPPSAWRPCGCRRR